MGAGKASNTGQQSHARTGQGIGQHRSSQSGSSLGPECGQRSKLDPGAHVGQKSGHETQMDVPPARRDADISSTSHSAGPLSPGEKGGSDDRR